MKEEQKMWLYLSFLAAILGGFTAIVMKKCSKDNLPIRLSLLGLLIGNISYVIIGACTTDVIQKFDLYNLIKIAPLSIIQTIGYICAIWYIKGIIPSYKTKQRTFSYYFNSNIR